MYCNRNRFEVSYSGGYCHQKLNSDQIKGSAWEGKEDIYGPPTVNLLPPDEGVAKVIMKNLNQEHIVVDIGAGVGQYGRYFESNKAKFHWYGYDGGENVESYTNGYVKWTDATALEFDNIPIVADWVLSLEVGHHIPREGMEGFLDTLDRHNKQGVILSWAREGTEEFSFQNGKRREEIIEIMLHRGYIQDDFAIKFEEEIRESAGDVLKDRLFVFRRQNSSI